MGRLRPSWNRNDLVLLVLQVPNTLWCSRGFTSRYSRRDRIIPLNTYSDFTSCDALEGNGSCDECLAIDKSLRWEYWYVP